MEFEGVDRFQHTAMATEWQIFLSGDAPGNARAARELFQLVDRLEADLSRFEPSSFISRLRRLRAGEVMALNEWAFECLAVTKALYQETGGAFDATVPSMREAPRKDRPWSSAMTSFVLDPDGFRIQTLVDDLRLDLGGVGKGFALDEMVKWLESNEFFNALVSAGGSTMYGMGSLPVSDGEGWPVTVGRDNVVALHQQAMSASGFEVQGAHIIDPRTGFPLVGERRRAWVFAPSAAIADGLSTAAMIMSEDQIESLSRRHGDITIMLV